MDVTPVILFVIVTVNPDGTQVADAGVHWKFGFSETGILPFINVMDPPQATAFCPPS